MKNSPPNPIAPFELTSKFDFSSQWSQKSLFENIVNPITERIFSENKHNIQRINEILCQNELFKIENFRLLWSKVNELAHENKLHQNIDYEDLKLFDPYNDGFQTLTINGWRQHIFNMLYCIRANYEVQFLNDYNKWLEVYRIFCSGDDSNNESSDLYNIGF
jgi:hypothetical protein